ncbi:DUF7146 domain-containing protein [Pelagerythrobacter marensis]|uniref:Zinc finger CHC2-type domain-containing protein n=1 Tax=Pelagerythrobacter marensis TaxID=543877 RepID=A0A0G3X6A2_9SPHN|nr:CHC2 zinc finger domain-containing protein [Pelagerythrobacter marensis]AKM06119.1 hypothetical protein AM2010_24 [Pelagerythrobacter marensis]
MIDIEAVKQAHCLPEVVGAVVNLQRVGREWKACCPLHNDRSPSFTIFDDGKRFQCFGCGASGDVLDFISALHGVGLREAAEMLTGGELPKVEVIRLPPTDDASDRVEEARSIWRASVPVEGTPAESYLRWRGISIPAPLSVRYSVLPYGKRGRPLPCLVCCVSSPEGPLQGIQRTYLAADGRGKADVPAPKLSLGRVSGGAIRLAPIANNIVVCEGLEDGLSLRQELGVSVWVAAGSAMLRSMRFPDPVREVAVGGDNDNAGREAAAKAAEAFALRGLASSVFFPPVPFKDFNDNLRGRT